MMILDDIKQLLENLVLLSEGITEQKDEYLDTPRKLDVCNFLDDILIYLNTFNKSNILAIQCCELLCQRWRMIVNRLFPSETWGELPLHQHQYLDTLHLTLERLMIKFGLGKKWHHDLIVETQCCLPRMISDSSTFKTEETYSPQVGFTIRGKKDDLREERFFKILDDCHLGLRSDRAIDDCLFAQQQQERIDSIEAQFFCEELLIDVNGDCALNWCLKAYEDNKDQLQKFYQILKNWLIALSESKVIGRYKIFRLVHQGTQNFRQGDHQDIILSLITLLSNLMLDRPSVLQRDLFFWRCYRQALFRARTDFFNALQELAQNDTQLLQRFPVEQQKFTQEGLRYLLKKMLDNCSLLLGGNIDATVLLLGSLSRFDATPYSDVEYAIIEGEDPQNHLKVDKFIRFFTFEMRSIGETTFFSFSFPEQKDSAGFCLDQNGGHPAPANIAMGDSFLRVHLAQLPRLLQRRSQEADLMAFSYYFASHLWGTYDYWEKYRKILQTHMTTTIKNDDTTKSDPLLPSFLAFPSDKNKTLLLNHQIIGESYLNCHAALLKQNPVIHSHDNTQTSVNLKHGLIYPIIELINDLILHKGLYHLEANNYLSEILHPTGFIDFLVNRGILDSSFASDLKYLLIYAQYYRIREQFYFGYRKESEILKITREIAQSFEWYRQVLIESAFFHLNQGQTLSYLNECLCPPRESFKKLLLTIFSYEIDNCKNILKFLYDDRKKISNAVFIERAGAISDIQEKCEHLVKIDFLPKIYLEPFRNWEDQVYTKRKLQCKKQTLITSLPEKGLENVFKSFTGLQLFYHIDLLPIDTIFNHFACFLVGHHKKVKRYLVSLSGEKYRHLFWRYILYHILDRHSEDFSENLMKPSSCNVNDLWKPKENQKVFGLFYDIKQLKMEASNDINTLAQLGHLQLIDAAEGNIEQARKSLLFCSQQNNDPTSTWARGLCYEYGIDYTQNMLRAVQCYRTASQKNYAPAITSLGQCYEIGIYGNQTEASKAFHYYRKAANQGYVVAVRHLARCYEEGIGIDKNLEKTFGLIRLANDIDRPLPTETHLSYSRRYTQETLFRKESFPLGQIIPAFPSENQCVLPSEILSNAAMAVFPSPFLAARDALLKALDQEITILNVKLEHKIFQISRPIKFNYRYTKRDIDDYIYAAVSKFLGQEKAKNLILEKSEPFWVLKLTSDYLSDGSNKEIRKMMTNESMASEQKIGERCKLYNIILPAMMTDGRELCLEHFDKTIKHGVLPDIEAQDIFDLLSSVLINPECNGRIKILFSYNLASSWHWLTGEVRILRHKDNYEVQIFSHDPLGGGIMEEAVFEKLKKCIGKRLLDLNIHANSIFHRAESLYRTRRQELLDEDACGPIAAEEIMKCFMEEGLDLERPYSISAIELRERQLRIIESIYNNDHAQIYLQFLERNTAEIEYSEIQQKVAIVLQALLDQNDADCQERIQHLIDLNQKFNKVKVTAKKTSAGLEESVSYLERSISDINDIKARSSIMDPNFDSTLSLECLGLSQSKKETGDNNFTTIIQKPVFFSPHNKEIVYYPGYIRDMQAEGNYFYLAVIEQLKQIGHPFLNTAPAGLEACHSLRLQVQGSDFQNKQWKGHNDIIQLAKKLNLVIALLDTRYPEQGFVYHYIDKNDTENSTSHIQSLPSEQPIIRLAFTGDQYLSVQSYSDSKHHNFLDI